jgi:hypothetical protein
MNAEPEALHRRKAAIASMTCGGRGLPRRAAVVSRRAGSPAGAADFARAAANHGSLQ